MLMRGGRLGPRKAVFGFGLQMAEKMGCNWKTGEGRGAMAAPGLAHSQDLAVSGPHSLPHADNLALVIRCCVSVLDSHLARVGVIAARTGV